MVCLCEWGLRDATKKAKILKIETFATSFMGFGAFGDRCEEGVKVIWRF